MNKKEDAIHRWYDDHAHEFAEADVIELPFVGKSREFQERLNRFKLWAVDHGGIVDLAGKHVLEFGAGHGRLALTYPDMASYTGVDYSKNLVELGNRRLERAGLTGRARLMRGDALTFDDQRQYDIVCSLGMMCYFADPVPVVTAMARLVKPGGQFFFDFRNDSWVYSVLRRIKWLLNPPTGGTTYVAHRRVLAETLGRLGFTDIRFVPREFPLLAERHASSGAQWPIALRNSLARSTLARPLATEAWVFAKRPLR